MTEKIYLEGGLNSSGGHVPARAWAAHGGSDTPPRDIWMPGDPAALLHHPREWFSRLKNDIEPVAELFGLRVRFCVAPHSSAEDYDIFNLLKAMLDYLSWRFEGLFLHTEVTAAAEPGIYLAWDAHPPIFPTQLWLKRKGELEGALPRLQPPLHLNLLLHNIHLGYNELWNDGTLDWFLHEAERFTEPPLRRRDVVIFSLARSDMRPTGMSVGLEQVVIEEDGRLSVGAARGMAG